MTTRLTNLPVPFTFQFNVTTSGTPEKLTVKRVASTIAFNEGSTQVPQVSQDTITDSASGFLVAGFQPGDSITVSGSASNDGTYVIDTVTAGTITLITKEDLTDEIAGVPVKIVATKSVPDGISVSIKAKNGNTGIIHVGYSSATALNSGGGSFALDNNEAISLQVEKTDSVWLDATVSGEGVEVIFEKALQA